MLHEQRVVAHAQAHDHVQVAAGFVQDARLHDRVARGFEAAGMHLHVVGDARTLLRHGTYLAGHGAHVFESLGAQDAGERLGPMHVAMPILRAPMRRANTMTSSTRVSWL